jgi:hypothetical protein
LLIREEVFLLAEIFATLFDVILPLSIPVIAGALLSRIGKLEIKPLLNFALYYITPFLIYAGRTNERTHQQTSSFSNLILRKTAWTNCHLDSKMGTIKRLAPFISQQKIVLHKRLIRFVIILLHSDFLSLKQEENCR